MTPKSLPRVFFGGALLLVGFGFLLDAVNVWDFGNVFTDWWPLAVVAVGLVSLSSNPRTPLWPLFIITVGVLLQLRSLDMIDFSVWQIIWPAALILIGLSFLFGQLFPRPKLTETSDSDIFVAFSGIETASAAKNYQGGKINAVFGGVDLDLRKATIKKEATLDMFVAFGGVELKVPEGWQVRTSGLPIFGGWEDKTAAPTGKHNPVLTINGTCIFGGVEIKN